jgi:gamma-glutamyltranspeptidase
MLNLIEPFDLKSMGHNSADYLHVLIEAKKIAYEDRARFYADMDFADVPVASLISKEYAAKRRELFDPKRAARKLEPGEPKLTAGDTIYLTVADRDRNMVSLIQSNYRGFGSGLVPDGLGFCLQDRGELFTLEEGHPNVYATHKRPFHTIIPAFVMQPHRLRHEPAGSGRRGTLSSPWIVGSHGRADDARRLGGARIGHLCESATRPRSARSSSEIRVRRVRRLSGGSLRCGA